jgi:3-hydroxymyristoyl/3-hydroxydecanoyl-(acyl carrier protein) dehydratase
MQRDEPFRLSPGGEGRFRIEIPAASPLFAGHFPDHPILPGIAHLAMVERALGRPLAAVRSVRLRRPVVPGEALELSLADGGGGWSRFAMAQGREAVGGGAVAPGDDAVGEWGEPRAAAGEFPLLLPHAPPARLVRGVVAAEAEGIVCVAAVPSDHPLAAGGRAPAFLAIEAAAQGAAALEALARRDDPVPRIGYLVGIREARLRAAALPVGRPFEVTARLAGSAPPLSVYEIAAGEAVAGTISTYVTTAAGSRTTGGAAGG